jgi:hypothetical protein
MAVWRVSAYAGLAAYQRTIQSNGIIKVSFVRL